MYIVLGIACQAKVPGKASPNEQAGNKCGLIILEASAENAMFLCMYLYQVTMYLFFVAFFLAFPPSHFALSFLLKLNTVVVNILP